MCRHSQRDSAWDGIGTEMINDAVFALQSHHNRGLQERVRVIRDLMDHHFAQLSPYDQDFLISMMTFLETQTHHKITDRQWQHLERVIQRMRLMSKYHK
jgi:predicted acyl esterase